MADCLPLTKPDTAGTRFHSACPSFVLKNRLGIFKKFAPLRAANFLPGNGKTATNEEGLCPAFPPSHPVTKPRPIPAFGQANCLTSPAAISAYLNLKELYPSADIDRCMFDQIHYWRTLAIPSMIASS